MRVLKGVGVGGSAVMGRLTMLGTASADVCKTDDFERDVWIAVNSCEPDVSIIRALAGVGAIGAIFEGEPSERCAGLIVELGLSAVFLSDGIPEDLRGGECVIISPEQNLIFISPDIETIDKFLTLTRDAREDSDIESVDISPVMPLSVTEVCAFAADAFGEGECESFERYRDLIEYIGERELIISFPRGLSADEMTEQIRAICRAAVYGRISFSVAVLNEGDYFDICRTFDAVCYELSREGREFQERVDIGVLIDGICGVVFARRICDFADFCLVDMRESEKMLSDRDKELFWEWILENIAKRTPKNLKKIKKRVDKQEKV